MNRAYYREYYEKNKAKINQKRKKAYQERRANKEAHEKHLQTLKDRYQMLKDYITDYLSQHPCEHCGNSDIRVLCFHHLDPSEKDNAVTRLRSKKKIDAEIEKCIVLCLNCHAIEHYRLRNEE